MISRESRILSWVLCVHLAGIYLFTKGFLLTRLALPDRSADTCTSLATHKKAVLLVIDALRFDFIAEHPPEPASPFHHNTLTLPRELTAAHPDRSFIFNSYSDPPTTTLQRLKGITTGSLPTFADAGENFGGSAIHEDSIMHQLNAAGRKIAFAGDDTWLALFPDAFQPNMTFAFDSFNVEDLHTVDQGVIDNILPLMRHHRDSWHFAIGHGLGVDHAGHRVGPDHPVLKEKLEQMNTFLHDVVAAMDDDTLLIMLGDHGMDKLGNHGGESVLETMSALWIYSKVPLSLPKYAIPEAILPVITFPGTPVPHRYVQQIDLLPTISLLLGLPIPFNNLGTVIPEVFNRDSDGSSLQKAMELNAAQIRRYLDAYRSSSSGKELDAAWHDFSLAWDGINATEGNHRLIALDNFTRLALSACRILWAQFNVFLMGAGLAVISLSIVAGWALYSKLRDIMDAEWEKWVDDRVWWSFSASAVGSALGYLMHVVLHEYLDGVTMHQTMIFAAAISSSFVMITTTRPTITLKSIKSLPIFLILHTLCFASNSFTVWEDRIVLFFLISSIVPSVITGFTAPTSRLRYRILGFSALFAICVRLMAMSTVCREEQHPYCTVTFYVSESSSAPPLTALLLALPVAIAVPRVVRRILEISKSDSGLAATFIPLLFAPSLIAGTMVWMLEWVDSAQALGDMGDILRVTRTILARTTVAVMLIGGLSVWWTSPVCLAISKSQAGEASTQEKTEVTVLGFANAFGSPYLMFWLIFFSIVWLMTQLAGQIVLGLSSIALLSYLEIIDSVRDVHSLNNAFTSPNASPQLTNTNPNHDLSFSEIVPLALLTTHTYYDVFLPSSHVSIAINTFGSFFLGALALPLIVLWNLPPLPLSPSRPRPNALRAGLAISLYFAVLAFGAAACGAVLRRHLMVWKIFAPRYLGAGCGLLVVDVGVLVGVGVGVGRVGAEIGRVFGRVRGVDGSN
ncbi:alkaline-phosphatase-like protein [Suillus subaureus]|uniref:Alkaline-phosphatase-like protein n=1 Tax=Suillus subaureus TaxID=48587 RepID=A0A9P7EKM6_9AGAM|nr:alkaline-phosphatase-like protein [Suillus subaureus]KAG1823672.1 alkaline-phosphatase-like protein [Suillus subaureus]